MIDLFCTKGTSPPPDPGAPDPDACFNLTPAGPAALDQPRRSRRSRQPDLLVYDHGSILLLRAVTNDGTDWLAENIAPDHQAWAGAVVVEPRYIADIVGGAQADGLRVTLSEVA